MKQLNLFRSLTSLLGCAAIACTSTLSVQAHSSHINGPQVAPFKVAISGGVRIPRGKGNQGNPQVAPPQSKPYGLTYGEWGARWWQWAYAIPFDSNPVLDPDGRFAAIGQSGPVWFLAGIFGNGSTVRRVTIPAGKAIFFPIVNILNDYPCPADLVPNFEPSLGQTLQDFLTYGNDSYPGAEDYIANPALNVEVNGKKLNNLTAYKGVSELFEFTAHPSLKATGDICITGTPQQGVSAGYWVMLRPLTPGSHTIRIRGSLPFFGGSGLDVTYFITVTP